MMWNRKVHNQLGVIHKNMRQYATIHRVHDVVRGGEDTITFMVMRDKFSSHFHMIHHAAFHAGIFIRDTHE